MHMTMQGHPWLGLLDEPPYGYGTDVLVQRSMVDHHTLEVREVQVRIVRRRVEEEDGSVRVNDRDGVQVLLDGMIDEVSSLYHRREHAFFGRHTTRIDVSRHIVSLPILEPERGRRAVGISYDRDVIQPDRTFRAIMNDPLLVSLDERRLKDLWIVVAQYDDEIRSILRPFEFPQL